MENLEMAAAELADVEQQIAERRLLSEEDLRAIEDALAAIKVPGDRYPAQMTARPER